MKLLTISFLIFFTAQVFAQKTALPEDVVASIQLRLDYGIAPSIVVGIIDKNGTQYYSFGTKTIGGKLVDEHSIYEIGSISKTFTATLLADNIVRGKMKADDPISKYLPFTVKVPVYSGGGQPISLGTLSDHTSSLPRLANNMPYGNPADPYSDYTVDLMYAFLSSYELPREVGSKFEYSNLAVTLLGHILALDGKATYEELLSKEITGPLKMKETAVTLNEKMKENLTIGHSMGKEVSNWGFNTIPGAGGIRSSVHDILLYLAANLGLNKTSLSSAMELAHTPRHDMADKVGLGWFTEPGSQGNITWHNGGTGGYRSFAGFVKETGRGVVVLTNSDADVDDIGRHLLDPESPLEEIKAPLMPVLKKIIDKDGPTELVAQYKKIMAENPGKYALDENAINALGYDYLGKGENESAIALFTVNIMEFPNSSNVYDSYGEALMKNGEKDEAILNYQKSLELNPGNTNAIEMLALMGVKYETDVIKVDEEILQSYTGTYELVPGFNIVITRVGEQLFGQATGQPQFELFPKSDTEFYLKIVEAKARFTTSDEGIVSMTWFQNGQELPAKRI
ncbi:MAG TPA: serine hydrolase [Saprospiraceae bacterium]